MREDTPDNLSGADGDIKAFMVMECVQDIKYASASASLMLHSMHTHLHRAQQPFANMERIGVSIFKNGGRAR